MTVDLRQLKTALVKPRILAVHPRWAVYNMTKYDSVSSHAWYVSYYSLLFADLERNLNTNVQLNTEKIARLAIYHDVPESITGDINYLVKQWMDSEIKSNDPVSKLLDTKAAKMLFGDTFSSYSDYIIEMSELTSPEARLVKSADKFECVMYILDCMEMGQKDTGMNVPIDKIFQESVSAFVSNNEDGFLYPEYICRALDISHTTDVKSPDTLGRI